MLAVATGSADFLVILFDGARECGVDYGADIGFVDAHAEGYRRDDYFQFSREEVRWTRSRVAGSRPAW